MPQTSNSNTLFYGDNLEVLREHVAAESVDLIYLDPPFNSKRDYNILFKESSGEAPASQIKAFGDTWQYNQEAERAREEISEIALQYGCPKLPLMIDGFVDVLGRNDVTAYLVMMAIRLLELKRVLKPTGSFYLHCDPTASHYLKIILDTIFGAKNFRNEIVWKRSSAHSDAAQGRKQLGQIHDVIFFYTKGNDWTWNPQYTKYDESYIKDFYRHVEPESGRVYRLDNLTGPGGAGKGNPSYEVMGVTRFWRYSKEKMQKLIEEGRIIQTRPGAVPAYKRYLDEMPGVGLQDLWTDLNPISAQAAERLGYPTQKPEALLERIIQASSNEGDVVLDPFCVTGETRVVTRDGLRPIREIRVGDEVLTHAGRYRPVLKLHQREYSGEMVKLGRARSNVALNITPNHPVWAVRAARCPFQERRCLPRECRYHRERRHLDCQNPKQNYKLEWIPAGELTADDWVYFPLTESRAPLALDVPFAPHHNAKLLPSRVAISPALMEWIGYFAAEGFVDQNSVRFANYEDADRIAALGTQLFGVQAGITPRSYRCKTISFNSRALSLWMAALVGRGASNKRLPEWVFGLDADCRQALICALLRSDGSFRRDKPDDASHSYRYGSASPTLSHQLWRLLLAEGIAANFLLAHPKPEGRHINGRPIRVNHPCYRVEVYDVESVNRLLQATREAPQYEETIVRRSYDSYSFENGCLFSIRQIEKYQAAQTVYNLEVAEDHSYVTDIMTVHNCGCGTTISVAQKLNRKWLGIDVTYLAVALIESRLRGQYDLKPKSDYNVVGVPADLASALDLFRRDAYQFQFWALTLIPAFPAGGEKKKGADAGIDGVLQFRDAGVAGTTLKTQQILVQVKGGHVSVNQLRDLRGTMEREKAALAFFVCLETPTKPMLQEAVAAGLYKSELRGVSYPRLQIRTVEELLVGNGFQYPEREAATWKQAARVQDKTQTTMEL